MDNYGFPRTSAKEQRTIRGFQTGEIVRARVPAGKKAGTYTGRLSVRSIGSFNIQTKQGLIQGIAYHYCVSLHKSDGYSYQNGDGLFLPHG
jgi:hypothetical protein